MPHAALAATLAVALAAFVAAPVRADDPHGLTIHVAVADEAPALGPIPVSITVTNMGAAPVRFVEGPWEFGVRIEGPEEWRPRLEVPGMSASHWLTDLPPGESVSRTVYLHALFERIPEGPAQLNVRADLSLGPDWDHLTGVTLTRTVATTIAPDTQDALKARLHAIVLKMTDGDFGDLRDALPVLRGLEHPDLVRVYLGVVRARPRHEVWYARRRLAWLSYRYQNYSPVVEYLVNEGTRPDGAIIQAWADTLGELDEGYRRRLQHDARDPWIRLYAYRYLPMVDGEQWRRRDFIAEMRQLGEEAAALDEPQRRSPAE